MPAGRNPGIFRAPLGRSRQPMARMTAPAWRVKDAVVGVDGGYGPIRRDVQYHGVELVGDLPLFYLRDKAGGVLRPGQFFLEGVEPEAVVDALI